MDLMKITDLTHQLGLTSRSLRYYEEAGLIHSVRLPGEKYRFYDGDTVERLNQIIVLRKMQIPVKEILRIYESREMSTIVDVFVKKIHEIDSEVTALSELKGIINDFLQKMTEKGITKISALPLLYEEMDKQLAAMEESRPLSSERLEEVSKRLRHDGTPAILDLPAMRVVSSRRRDAPNVSDPEGFWLWAQSAGLSQGRPGRHEQFEYQSGSDSVFVLRTGSGFETSGDYLEDVFEGGLYAALNVYLDENLGEAFSSLVSSFDENPYYEVDYSGEGLRREALLENLTSPDEQRELVSLLLPIKKRLAPPELYGNPKEADSVTWSELEADDPVLWTKKVRMDELIPINGPHYRVTEKGEAEYVSWISTRVLSTGVEVKIPFRVDMECKIGEESGGWGHGRKEESIRFHHGGDLTRLFGINMNNSPDESLSQEAICFHQPVFGNYFCLPGRGKIKSGEYNTLTWIVGLKHFAVIVNGEIRYCGVNFPYMSTDLSLQQPMPILIGSNSSIKKYYRSISVSQLTQTPKSKIKKKELTMVTKKSNHMISKIHRLASGEYGENYWFNGCARYLMEASGELTEEPSPFGYWFFAGLTGDIFTQVYSYGEYMGESVSSCLFNLEGGGYLEDIFAKCGYASTFVSSDQLAANTEMYLQTLTAYIDKEMPVMTITHRGPAWGVYVGYEEYGKTLLFITGEQVEPERIPIDDAMQDRGWLFLGEKKRTTDPKELYRSMIAEIPKLFAVKNEKFCFGPEAFRAWAARIESGYFENMTSEEFDDGWGYHGSNICNMATNGSCADEVLKKAEELNPDLTFLGEVRALYGRTAAIWNGSSGGTLEEGAGDLEAIGGGFNVTLHTLQEPRKRGKIAAKIREAADCMDKVAELIQRSKV